MPDETTIQQRTAGAVSDSPPRQLILFRVAQELYALATSCVEEVAPLPALVRIPSCPDVVEGFLNLSGAAVPVIRLDRLLGLPLGNDHLYTPLLILQISGDRLALLVDQVQSIVMVDEAKIVPIASGETINDCALAMAAVAGHTAIVLDARRLLLKQEMVRLNTLKELAQQRIAQLEVETA